MALKDPYCDIATADTYLASSTVWTNADNTQKQNALFWGRTWMDTYFSCPNLDEANPSDEIQYANALAAEDYLEGTLLSSTGTDNTSSVKKKRTKSDVTETETTYSSAVTTNPQQDIEALLSQQCNKSKASAGNYRVVTRV